MYLIMDNNKEQLIERIEEARTRMNHSIDAKEEYEVIYQYSLELDQLIAQYIDAGY